MPADAEARGEDILSEEPVEEGATVLSEDEANSVEYASVGPTATARSAKASFQSIPDQLYHGDFLRRCVDVLLEEAVFQGTARSQRVVEWRNPEQLMRLFDFKLGADGATHDELVQLVRDTIRYSVKTGHPYFVNQLFSSLDPYGLIGQWLTDALNPSVYTYEVSPVFTLMEEVVLREMRQIVGFEGGKGDGIFCPGGSMANAYAISCARYKFNPDIKKTGLHGLPRLVVFTSEDAHYSVTKMASFMGIGSDNVYKVRTDARGRMSAPHLVEAIERALSEGAAPFMVSATAGTTVLGAFDPLHALADVCARYKLWLHVDAAWGGGALMSKRFRYLLDGINRADSVTWNPHKLLTAPQQCSTFLVQHEGVLAAAHSANAAYLFQKDKFYNTAFDTGDKHVQCGRRADVLKFWFMWKAKGSAGFEQHIDRVFDTARFFTASIRNCQGFKMVLEEPECTNVCFWYIPPSLQGAEALPDYHERLHKVAPKIKERMMKEGTMMVTYQTQKGLPNFFRIVFQNSGLEKADMLHLVREFERLGQDL